MQHFVLLPGGNYLETEVASCELELPIPES